MIRAVLVHAPGLSPERHGSSFCSRHRMSLPFRILLKRMHRLVLHKSAASADQEINRMMQELRTSAKAFSHAEKLLLRRPVKETPEGGMR